MPSEPLIYHDYIIGVHPMYQDLLERCDVDPVFFERTKRECMARNEPSTAYGVDLLFGYRKYGQQTFVVGPKLQNLFNRTRLTGIQNSDVKCPYPEFYVALPDNKHPVWGGEVTQWHPVAGVLVRRVEDGFVFYMWGQENSKSRAAGDDCTYWFSLDLTEVTGDVEDYLQKKLRDPSRDIGETIYGPRGIEVNVKLPEDERRETIVTTSVVVARIILNMCLYLASSSPETGSDPILDAKKAELKALQEQVHKLKKNTKSRSKVNKMAKRLERKRGALSKANVVWIAPTIERTPTTTTRESSTGLRARHWVRGHWKNQPTKSGPVRMWILPYERNKTSPVRVEGHIYQIKTEDTQP